MNKNKIILMVAGALCLGVAAYGQDPTQQAAPTQPTPPTQQDPTPQDPTQPATPTQDPTQPTTPPQDPTLQQPTQPSPEQPSPDAVPAYRKDMTQIQAGDVPEGLRSTLDRPQFSGWENGSVYSNPDKSIFIVEIKDEVEGRLKAYRFDANGKPIMDN